MQPIVVFIILAIILGGFFYFGQLPKQEEEEIPQAQEAPSQIKESVPIEAQTFLGAVGSALKPVTKPTPESAPKPTTESTPKSTETEPTISINTYIISGPKEGEVIDETNKVTFEFKAKVSPKETEGRITFETKIEGIDEDWKKTSSQKRTINLPSGPKEYTFLVRAKIKDVIDPTPAKRTFKINTSPYFSKVKISSVRAETSSRSSSITLTTSLKEGEEINITGWRIRGKKGGFTIPSGIEKYKPYYNPVPDESIFIDRSGKIYLSGASNPLGRGRNFRINKCFGYLANYRDFPTPITKNCPKPTREEISHLSPCCQEFILRLGRCEIPEYSSNFRISRDSECVAYLNKNLNYGGCYRKYSKDEDFLGKSWHIYMNRDFISKSLDTLYLRDQNGLLVDKYSYGCLICE